MHKLVQYFQSLYGNEDIYELKGVHIANANSYQCSCKQYCAIAVYAMCYSVINSLRCWTSGTLSALASNRNTLYNVMGVKRHIMPVDLPQTVSTCGADINLTFRAVSSCVLCCNLVDSLQRAKLDIAHLDVLSTICYTFFMKEINPILIWPSLNFTMN